MRAGRLAEAAAALSEGLFLLQDPWLQRERSVQERLQLWTTHFVRRCRSDSEGGGDGDGESKNDVFFLEHLENATAFQWSEAPRATAVAIVTMQVIESISSR